MTIDELKNVLDWGEVIPLFKRFDIINLWLRARN